MHYWASSVSPLLFVFFFFFFFSDAITQLNAYVEKQEAQISKLKVRILDVVKPFLED